jgi:tRNA-Thr(GGU) m(6)t(6)A37 methyltransferase TsaA
MKRRSVVLAGVLAGALACPQSTKTDGARDQHLATLAMQPIGYVSKADGRTTIVLEEKYQPGLLGLNGFSHVYVLWWFSRNDTPQDRAVLQVHPRRDPENPLTGVFATRSPRRPNLIALTLCKIVSVKENVIEVETIDALPDIPVLDLKPLIPGYDSAQDARMPDWVSRD